MTNYRIAQALADLDAWLETMRQPGGYGGPVAHWWQNRFQYTGPGLDWRYEGILIGYATLYRKTSDDRWRAQANAAATDLIDGQRPDGSFRASRFEINPGTLGTPHEAAASLGLLSAAPVLDEPDRAVRASQRNLAFLVEALWDGEGIADRPGGRARVPNKLATLAQALMRASEKRESAERLEVARRCLDDIARFQEREGPYAGAVHQYAPDGRAGDGRFFPYYNARCVIPLVQGADVFDEPAFRRAAEGIAGFLDRTYDGDGGWPQIVYANGRMARQPRWIAGVADIVLAYRSLGRSAPEAVLSRLLDGQLRSGGFRTADGFSSLGVKRVRSRAPDLRAVVPVVGWNDKTFRLLTDLLLDRQPVPKPTIGAVSVSIQVRGRLAKYDETPEFMRVCDADAAMFSFSKSDPWADVQSDDVNVR